MSDELPYFFPRRRRLRAHTPEPKSRREKSEVAALGSVVDIDREQCAVQISAT